MEGKLRERRGGKGREEVEERQGTGELKGRGRDAREKGGKGRGKERKEKRGREKKIRTPPPSIPAYAPGHSQVWFTSEHVAKFD